MAIRDILDILMFVAACGFLMAGFPVAFTLAGTALIFAGLGAAFGVFDLSFLGALPSRIFGNAMTNEVLIAVPLFVFMGVMLERSKVAEELLEAMGALFGTLRGGLGISVSVVGALLAASTGIVGATVVTMGLLSLPTMLRRGYAPWLACGTICAAGTLGQIIPPSIILILLADQISNAHADAQRSLGNFAPEPVSVGDLFAGALFPGLMLVGLYIAFQIVVAWLRPETSPAIPRRDLGERQLSRRLVQALFPPIALIVAVLGSILAGIATPTEAAAVGAVGAMLLAGARARTGHKAPQLVAALALFVMLGLANTLDLRVTRAAIPPLDRAGIAIALAASLGLLWGIADSLLLLRATPDGKTGVSVLAAVMRSTMELTSMVFLILIGASAFSLVFRGLGGDDTIHQMLTGLPGGPAGAMIAVMAAMFLLGFFLDFVEIIFIVVPVVAPVLLKMGFDPIWLGVMMGVNLQTSFLTPPFGFSLFYLRAVAPPSVRTGDIYMGIIPFVALQIIGLGVVAYYLPLSTWLPKVIFG